MYQYKREELKDGFFLLEVFECPNTILLQAAQMGSEHVTIENFMHYGRKEAAFRFEIQAKDLSVTPVLQRFNIDFTISKNEFLQLSALWDEQGCYAFFHDAPVLKFRASDLPETKRYKALDNFGWTLEMIIPGPASSGWGSIASPHRHIIDRIEEQLK